MSSKINQDWKAICKYMNDLEWQYHLLAKYYGLSDSSFWVLYELYENKEGCTQKDLCDDWALNKQTINSAVKGLIKDGYVVLEDSEDSKKTKMLRLTEEGRNIAKNTVGKAMNLEKRAFKNINENEMTKVVRFFEKQTLALKNEVNNTIKE